MEYPKHKYHPEKPVKVVMDEKQEAALGDEWFDSPADFGVESHPGLVPDEEIAKKAKKPSEKKASEKKDK